MGASAFIETVRAYSIEQGYKELKHHAIMKYGCEPYNGTISTCDLGSCKKRFESYSERNKKEAYEYIKSIGNGEKYIADCIDLGVVEYRLIKPVKINYENSPKYKLKYIVKDCMGIKFNSYMTKTEAVNKALELTAKNMKDFVVTKEYDLVEGNNLLTRCCVKEKSYKTKPKSIPKNSVLKEVHEYIFFGWAAE